MFGPSPYALPLSSAKSTAGRPPIVRAVRSSDGSHAAGELHSKTMSNRPYNTQRVYILMQCRALACLLCEESNSMTDSMRAVQSKLLLLKGFLTVLA